MFDAILATIRVIAGSLVGLIAGFFVYLMIFESISVFPLWQFGLELMPGMIVGGVVAYYFPVVTGFLAATILGAEVDVEAGDGTSVPADHSDDSSPRKAD